MEPTIKEVAEMSKRTSAEVAALTKDFGGLLTQLSKTPAANQPNPAEVFGKGMAPWARNGEDPMSSRGFSFSKMIGLITGSIPKEQAKIEMDIAQRLNQVYVKDAGSLGYQMAGVGNRLLAPLGTDLMHDPFVSDSFRYEMKSLIAAGAPRSAWDPNERNWIARKMLNTAKSPEVYQKALSWLTETQGAALVPPAEFGELIELLRNKEALVNAGAKTVPLPPQGRIQYPRQTSASLAYWIGENANIPDSTPGTGTVTLSAKKLAVRIIAPNELLRFASPAAEALLRDDMTKTLALKLDLAGLEGTGTDAQPRGVINLQYINQISSSQQGPNGDYITGKDIYRFIAAVEESNAEFEAFIMRPKTLYKYYQLRADAVGTGDQQGLFLFNAIREAGDGVQAMLGGKKVVTSTQVSQSRTKGSATNLTYIVGGMWSDMLIGMFGAIEFAAATQGDTAFANDQTWVRGILSADIAARHDAAFVWMDNLDTTI